MKSIIIRSLQVILLILVFSNFNISKTEIRTIIEFKMFTDTIKSKKFIEEIKSYGNEFKALSSDNMNYYIELRNYTCDFELNKNPSIGFQRAKVICDILEKECSISRIKVHYIDITGRELSPLTGKSSCESMFKTQRVGIKLELH